MPWNRPLILGLLIALLALTWWRLQPQADEVRRSQFMMGTVVEILAQGEDPSALDEAVTAAFAEMARLDRLLSSHRQESDISRLSLSETGLTVATETAEVIALGLQVARRSAGAFDLTLGRLKTLWALDSDSPQVPSLAAITATLDDLGPEALMLSGRMVRKANPALQVDLGGIAKGYAVDRGIAVLKEHGVTAAAINAGGDMYLLGQRLERPWRIGIQHPRQPNAVLVTVQVSDRAVVTSGDYERFFEQNGKRYHHLFDPKSGFPAQGCRSVTIVAESVALADALATAVFVLGPLSGLEMLKGYSGAEGMIVAADGRLYASDGWAAYQVEP